LTSLDLELHRFSAAEARIRKLEAVYPEDTQLKELARNLEAERGAVFELEVRPSWSRGGGTNQAGNELTVSARLWSPPIRDRWRAFVFDDYSYAHPIEGFVERHHAGAGAELRLSDVTATAYGTYSTGELEKPGGGFTLDWQANDQLGLGLAGEIFSIGTPLRALFEHVTGNEIGGHIGYRWHESREISLSSSYLDVSDGNQRESVGLDFSQRLVDIPRFDLTGRLGAFGSTNSQQDVAYYSPERDLTATVGLLAEQALAQLPQRFGAGLHARCRRVCPGGLGTDWIATVAYEHRWQFNPMTSFHYGVLLTRRVYDGDPERSVALTLGLTRRF
jgi:biofilm PGA synthesis protein PgaA